MLGILGRHAFDEAWVPDGLAGRAAADGDPLADVDLLGDDPIPADEGFAHLSMYRAGQAYLIAKEFGIPFHLSAELIEGLNEHVTPHADEWRQFGVFPPAIEPPAGADDETVLMCALGFWKL